MPGDDPFGTAELRRRVLAAWRESPARFRADANVEDDLAVVGYRDRVVVELAQNAADAASRAGVAGHLTLTLADGTLTAANTGAPLDAAGVASMAVARASAKRGESGAVGRFGVGFAAVLSVTDEPRVASHQGAVAWSRARAVTEVSNLRELAEELAHRGDRVPVLRLPYADPAPLPDGADTAVTLPLRDGDAAAAVRSLLDGLDPTLLLALPALETVVIRVDGKERVLRRESAEGGAVTLFDGDARSRWAVHRASGRLPAGLLADRPLEERDIDRWEVVWALPVDAGDRLVALPDWVTPHLGAPTPTDEPVSLPALLIASYPLDVTRRHVVGGRVADEVTRHVADELVAAIGMLPADPSVLRLVPVGMPAGAFDAAVRSAALDRMRTAAWLPVAGQPEVRQRATDAVAVADGLVEVLQGVAPTLLPAGWSGPPLTALAVRRLSIADVVDAVAAVEAEPAWWHDLYAALDTAAGSGPDRDALGALPVPLADGTTATGPRGTTLPADTMPDVDLTALGIRVVHPAAAHRLLRRLGAVETTPRALLTSPRVRAAVEASYDEDDPAPLADAVLAVVAAGGVGADELPWLADLALPDTDGDWRPAGELLLPGGLMARLVRADSALGVAATDVVDRWGADVLRAVGVIDAPAVLRVADALGPEHDLDDEAQWWSRLPPGAAVAELAAVRDLEQVRDDAWPELLPALAAPPLREVVLEPARVLDPDDGTITVRSYTAWWLSTRPVLGGRAPRELRLPTADPALHPLYDVVADVADAGLLSGVGVLDRLEDADPADVLLRLASPERSVSRAQLRMLYHWVAGHPLDPPARLRALRRGSVVVVDAADAVIVDAPDLRPLLADRAVVPASASVAEQLADTLDIPLASELAEFAVVSTGQPVDDAVLHEPLVVVDVDGVEREVAWRLVGDTLHVDRRHLAIGLGRGRAWRSGTWPARHLRSEEIWQPSLEGLRLDEADLDGD